MGRIIAPAALFTLALMSLVPEACADDDVLRVATFNIEDVRTDDLRDPDHPRLKQAAAILQSIRPAKVRRSFY